MKSRNKGIITAWWLRSFLFLLIAYTSQLYTIDHLHHTHNEDATGVETRFLPIDVDLDHSADHQHDTEIPHKNDHQHTYNSHVDWHIIRIQNQRTVTIDDQRLFATVSSILTISSDISSISIEETIYVADNPTTSLIIRGPPLFV